jgi:hypothetical protein
METERSTDRYTYIGTKGERKTVRYKKDRIIYLKAEKKQTDDRCINIKAFIYICIFMYMHRERDRRT